MSPAETLLRAHELEQARLARYAQRKRVNQIALSLSLLAMAFGLFWLFWILIETCVLGIGGLTLSTLTQMTPPPNDAGGLANAIYGSFLMVLLATFVGWPASRASSMTFCCRRRRLWLVCLSTQWS